MMELPSGNYKCYLQGINKDDANSCVVKYFQQGLGTVYNSCLNDLLGVSLFCSLSFRKSFLKKKFVCLVLRIETSALVNLELVPASLMFICVHINLMGEVRDVEFF